MSVLKEAIVTI